MLTVNVGHSYVRLCMLFGHTSQTLSIIFKKGFSRIPVFGKDHNDVIGLLFTKDLIFIDPDDETPLKNFVQIFGRAVTVCLKSCDISCCI